MCRVAYKIQKASRAHYILMNFEVGAKWINDFKSMLDKDERVIRHLVMKQDKTETEDCPPPPEFHTMRAGTDDENEEGEDDIDMEMNDDTDGIILVDADADDDVDDRNSRSSQQIDTHKRGKRKDLNMVLFYYRIGDLFSCFSFPLPFDFFEFLYWYCRDERGLPQKGINASLITGHATGIGF
ncbi:hypothetical protein K7X08_010471 [Anisodus acutangulus]|uniref:Ribosomal protein S6 n=1 Tax=Anisodus acutangulus TaxID=402998 RepID=A0A9Q1N1T7_9SOLA|nr:hypothetical protein K7X08_010471 [Anisodus acutangulus]